MYWLLKTRLALLLSLSCFGIFYGQSKEVVVNPGNTQISFTVKHLGVLTVEGSFKEFEGFLEFDNENLLRVRCNVLVSSIDTDDDFRDDTLRSEAYFDVQQFPAISFIQTNDTVDSDERDILGLLQIKDVQKQVALKCDLEAFKTDGQVLNLTTEISREYFELEFGSMNALIGDTVKIQIRINL